MKVIHDCPYESFGEPCQCDEDWLETLTDYRDNAKHEQLNIYDLKAELSRAIQQLKTQLFILQCITGLLLVVVIIKLITG